MKLSFSLLFLHFICLVFFSIKENHHIWLPITLVHWKEKPSTLRWNDKQQRRTSYLNEWSNLSIFIFFFGITTKIWNFGDVARFGVWNLLYKDDSLCLCDNIRLVTSQLFPNRYHPERKSPYIKVPSPYDWPKSLLSPTW